ncbi:bifunctional UDP-N-acetylglucosamine diphosphorylase/glucosamine-1-phosphate N-acetyltransferase GlmU [Sedimentibacter sp. zth1]|uniref:bifunctional UDP-N-acetylglucosamine diphosphorylase/glucosamine-1-phosphate N-acetyltransferase GlmU n=1 Tax=Sedimentibacter sp. zth1 TaxID=2816908 RepID=UPI001A925882|nr:bifunctional UDP-N-acetylglucosamine diphosphorylase/glucosamine-1-phosphate N-acetyltransferase GlmU [Sedimentibacter sp. zth1]QSX07359.1 bifunctional UDP-N-acetylglucosamine diphosphorylase/glucosamine-1-phosphate N-acetyltransferase GlmU [Sedimentibacter sp. zth1]
MMYMSIILAAGEGTRMKSSVSKVLHKVCGREIVKYVIDATEKAGIDKNVVVLGHSKEQVKDCLQNENVVLTEQPIGNGHPYGTGYAVMCAKEYINDEDTVVLLCGDGPLIKAATIKNLLEYHENGKYALSILTCMFDNPVGLGRIVRNLDGTVDKIVEQKDADDEQIKIKEINTGIFCFNGKLLKEALLKLDTNNSQNEYYITDTVKILGAMGYKIGAFTLNDEREIKAVNDRVQLAEVNKLMQERINELHLRNGVTMIDPSATYVDADVVIGRDTILYPGTIIETKSIIGEGCIIGPNTRIINSEIKNGVSIDNSKVIDSFIDNNTNVGPFAYLRPGTKLGKNVKIGDFVEVKNSTIDDNTKASHLSYIGDAEVGSKVNIGCGVVFVNYDGIKKHKTIVKNGAFVGSNSNLIAPVTLEERAYVACGSTITDDVEEETLAIARARQVNKPGKGKGRF